ncbi:type II and III secretion system protein family protein [Planctomycetes bacterium K23_9]|uniref:Type II secretion system protein D n=1 Tax=Stieleria marina TaxID=1930275 RepID=A0A517P2V3_9BACT|nr:Putative type II secretion system protein D precursor [Planctomycetes bacterium K23_9]
METTRLSAQFVKKRIAAILSVACLVAVTADTPAYSADAVQLTSADSAANHNINQSVERLEMLVKSSRILTLEARVPKFQVHNEEVLGATPVSQNQIQIFAKTPGTTQLNLWDTNDKLYTVDVTVLADAREVEGILGSQLPLATLKVLPVNSSAIVSGYVTSADDVDRAVAIVEQYYATVVNNIKVIGVQQVLLHTRIMEVSRTKLRDLGIDWNYISSGKSIINAPSSLIDVPQSVVTDGILEISQITNGGNVQILSNDFNALIKALRQEDLVKFLAEPTVVATHGRPARFIVGGKVPYTVPAGNGSVTVAYEEFGTSVDFLPFVVGPGRIRLEVRPEVKEIDEANSLNVSGTLVPGFSQRYVETAVELSAGQTLALAGLLQSRTESSVKATPFFGEIPYFGAMFRRVTERRNDIELLITVTPELVDAMDPHEVPRGGPGLNSTSPNDKELYMKGHIEVPNMLGGDGCTPSVYNIQPGSDHLLLDPTNNSSSAQYGTPSYGNGGHHSASTLPPGAIVPQNQPIEVGQGVTITAPVQ